MLVKIHTHFRVIANRKLKLLIVINIKIKIFRQRGHRDKEGHELEKCELHVLK